MHSFRQQLIAIFSILFILICSIHYSRANAEEHHADGKIHDHDQTIAGARLQILKQVLTRRGLYDPAFGDSWSNYFDKKRALFDPAYGDWANSFKRSDE